VAGEYLDTITRNPKILDANRRKVFEHIELNHKKNFIGKIGERLGTVKLINTQLDK